mmetsp:Transcript_14379/g.25755  ORF Transcript_14379/g.25755 Transcript_14379/m.25755 type:complete len:265 (-) Transcript_14379:1595-2389(-)
MTNTSFWSSRAFLEGCRFPSPGSMKLGPSLFAFTVGSFDLVDLGGARVVFFLVETTSSAEAATFKLGLERLDLDELRVAVAEFVSVFGASTVCAPCSFTGSFSRCELSSTSSAFVALPFALWLDLVFFFDTRESSSIASSSFFVSCADLVRLDARVGRFRLLFFSSTVLAIEVETFVRERDALFLSVPRSFFSETSSIAAFGFSSSGKSSVYSASKVSRLSRGTVEVFSTSICWRKNSVYSSLLLANSFLIIFHSGVHSGLSAL